MRANKNQSLHLLRLKILLFVLGILALLFLSRIIYLHIFAHDFLVAQGNMRALRTINVHAYRGIITDRNGEPLAVTAPVDSVWVNPKVFQDIDNSINILADKLNIKKKDLLNKLNKAREKEFLYIKRHIDPTLGIEITKLKIPGVNLVREYRRYYPASEVTAHVVGFTDIDDIGQEAIELAYNETLRSKTGTKVVVRDRLGRIIEDVKYIREPEEGHAIALSIDRRIQYFAHQELSHAVKKHKAKSGSAVIIKVKTGEILAMVNQPVFNPNNRTELLPTKTRNRAVTDIYEPGSVIKAFSVAALLESGQFTPHTLIDTNPGKYIIDGEVVRDIRNYGLLDLTQVIQKSSNVGISKGILTLDPAYYRELLINLGFTSVTASGFPGEGAGTLALAHRNDNFTRATQAFGYGLSVTTLQLAHAFATLGNLGVEVPTTFMRQDSLTGIPTRRVLSKNTAKQVLTMLERVTAKGGSGVRAQVHGYSVIGKTGTARKFTKEGYSKNKHRGLFAGLIPANNPELAMVIMLDEPTEGGYYGGLVAAPVFAKVMAKAVRILDINPDSLSAKNIVVNRRENLHANK